LDFKRQALHAQRIGFLHPVTGGALTFECDIPSDMQRLLSELRI
jgi:23S rRNA pseudouridine1911/1915/1917 synthase